MSARAAAVGLFCISGGLLSYEFLLMRLLSLAHWGHFAGLVFSIALLGLAASSLVLHHWRERICANPSLFFCSSAGLFSVSAPVAFYLSQSIPFAPFLLAWSAQEYLCLGVRIFMFFVPFFVSGIAVGIPYVARLLPASRLYCWSMLGSAVPTLSLLIGMAAFHPVRLLTVASLLGTVSGLLGSSSWLARLGCLLAGSLGCLLAATMPFRYSEYKALPKTLLLPEARLLDQRPHWQGIVETVRSKHTRYLPGLSLNFDGNLPQSELVFVDGSAMEVVFDARESLADPAFLRLSPEALSYELKEAPKVLALGGVATEILRALALKAASIVAVDDCGERIEAIRGIWERFGFSPMRLENVFIRENDARLFLQTTDEKFDLIFLSLLASHATSTAGAASLDPNYLFTREGLSLLLAKLTPGGHAVFTLWVENPPRTGVKLASLIIDALSRSGAREPSRHILALRSWSTLAFSVAPEPFPRNAIERLKRFAEKNSFDLVHYDGMAREEANRFNVIPKEPYVEAFEALLSGGANEYRLRWPFNLGAATDDAPFFSHHFRWAAVPEFVGRMGKDWVPYVEWGYLLVVATLAVTAMFGTCFLVVPCLAGRVRVSPVVSVFFLLGFAYMFVEMWAVYRLIYWVSYPSIAFAVTLAFMLAGSGAGAAVLVRRAPARPTAGVMLVSLLVVLAIVLALSELAMGWALKQALFIRILAAGVWMAMPAFFMGFPFPFALENKVRPEEIPWALGLNGLGSVLGSLVATLLAVHFGLNALAGAALVLYFLAAVMIMMSPRLSPPSGPDHG
ncbi:MAG: hypothetical protein HY735_05405 [Verrucomicrobia bacterium]|nr:hypothetical protein [Verrucomicrobiota bacterium]